MVVLDFVGFIHLPITIRTRVGRINRISKTSFQVIEDFGPLFE